MAASQNGVRISQQMSSINYNDFVSQLPYEKRWKIDNSMLLSCSENIDFLMKGKLIKAKSVL
jgi:hypothetical protein